MPEIQLNGKTIATQTGTNEPVLKNNVVMESGFSIPSSVIDSALLSATFPDTITTNNIAVNNEGIFGKLNSPYTFSNTNSLTSGTLRTFATDGTESGVYLLGMYRDNNTGYQATAIMIYRPNAGVNTVGYFVYLSQQNISFSIDTSTGALTYSGAYGQGNWWFCQKLY